MIKRWFQLKYYTILTWFYRRKFYGVPRPENIAKQAPARFIRDCDVENCKADDELEKFISSHKKQLAKHIEDQYEKARINSHVIPPEYVRRCEITFSHNLEDIAWNVCYSMKYNEAQNYRYHDFDNGINMIITILPWTADDARRFLVEISDDPAVGYIPLMTKLFLNDWPSPELTEFFHVIICYDENMFLLHSAMSEYGGSPTGHRNFTMYPIDLFGNMEKMQTGLT